MIDPVLNMNTWWPIFSLEIESESFLTAFYFFKIVHVYFHWFYNHRYFKWPVDESVISAKKIKSRHWLLGTNRQKLTCGCMVQKFDNIWVWNHFEDSNFFDQSWIFAVQQFQRNLLCCEQSWKIKILVMFFCSMRSEVQNTQHSIPSVGAWKLDMLLFLLFSAHV